MNMIQSENNKLKGRLLSLDAFRGFTIIGMIIVNSPGSWNYIFPPLRHAEWNGLTITDLVFPFFLFIVGVSIVLSYSKKRSNNISKKNLLWKATKRSIIIFGLGIILNLVNYRFQEFRLMGVLQRIAIVYYICTLLFLYAKRNIHIIIGISVLFIYWIIMYFLPIKGLEIDLSVPGKNIGVLIDSKLLPGKLYFGTWDPEGILSTFPSIVTAITGMIAGFLILSQGKKENPIIRMFVIGFVFIIIGYCWSWFFPLNKSIWSSSYVVFTSGLAFLTLASLIWIIDVLNFRKFSKIGIIFGTNAITAYVIHGILYIPLDFISIGKYNGIQSAFLNSLFSTGIMPEFASLLWAIIYTFLCFIPIWILYNRKIFIKI